MKCRKCGDTAALELRRHNAAFCSPHFIEFFQKQVREAIRHYRMLEPGESVLVAVSGGKDSLALWDVLLEDGLVVGEPVDPARACRLNVELL